MPDGLTTPVLRQALRKVAARIETVAAELNELDGVLGDGDLGITMVRGCRAITGELDQLPGDLGLAFLQCAKAFTRTSGSTFGTLIATGLMSAAKAAKGRTEIPWAEMSSLLDHALTAMSQRGRSQLGDKTVLDAVDAVRSATANSADPAAMLQAAEKATAEALDRLRDQPAKQGRARIFGDKSVGRDDGGMVVVHHIVKALAT